MVWPPEQAYCFHIRLTGILLTKKPLRGEAWICYVLKKLLLSFVCCLYYSTIYDCKGTLQFEANLAFVRYVTN